jgi:hypothetical protein
MMVRPNCLCGLHSWHVLPWYVFLVVNSLYPPNPAKPSLLLLAWKKDQVTRWECGCLSLYCMYCMHNSAFDATVWLPSYLFPRPWSLVENPHTVSRNS